MAETEMISVVRRYNKTTMKNQIQLGNKVRCIVSGFTGIVISRLEYLNGCVQYGVKPKVDPKTGKSEDANYIDSEQLRVIGAGIAVKQQHTGGPSSDAPKHEYRG